VPEGDTFLSRAFIKEVLPAELTDFAIHSLPPVGAATRSSVATALLSSWLQESRPSRVFLTGDGLVLDELNARLTEVGIGPEDRRSEPFFRKPVPASKEG